MHPLLTELSERLVRFGTPHDATDQRVTVPAKDPDGFDVDLTITGSEAVVTLGGGWHESFSLPEESEPAQQLFMLALTEAARLKVTRRGGVEHLWTLETRVEGVWGHAGTTGMIFVPFWKRKHQDYRRNAHIDVAALAPWIPERFGDAGTA